MTDDHAIAEKEALADALRKYPTFGHAYLALLDRQRDLEAEIERLKVTLQGEMNDADWKQEMRAEIERLGGLAAWRKASEWGQTEQAQVANPSGKASPAPDTIAGVPIKDLYKPLERKG